MKKNIASLLIMIYMCMITVGAQSYFGFEGGASNGGILRPPNTAAPVKANAKQSYQYSEMVFLTGVPMLFTGTLEITKTTSKGTESYNYSYNLTNGTNKLTRRVQYEATVTTSGAQTVRVYRLKSKTPSETIKIGTQTYQLVGSGSFDFSMSTIVDSQPAIDYHKGNWNSRKTYTSKDGSRVTITTTGQTVGYDQFWGRAETQDIRFAIEAENFIPVLQPTPKPVIEYDEYGDEIPQKPVKHKPTYEIVADSWGGSGDIKISGITAKKLSYDPNAPQEISFEGGYLQKQENNTVLSYTAKLPTFDDLGIANDIMEEYFDSIATESFPEQERLFFPDNRYIKGYWYEKDVMELYSLNVLPTDEEMHYKNFESVMTRGEFAQLVVSSINLPLFVMPPPPKVKKPKKGEEPEPIPPVSPFKDVHDDHPMVIPILTVEQAGIMSGMDAENFGPQLPITRAQALTVFVRALGFQNMLLSPVTLTDFEDNDKIPAWARNAIGVSHKIGLVKGDDSNKINPDEWMTKSEACAFVNRLINYMREQIVLDYRDRLLDY